MIEYSRVIAASLECFPEKPIGVGMNRYAKGGGWQKCKAP